MADRVQALEKGRLDEQVKRVFLDAYQRAPDAEELFLAKRLAGQYGLVHALPFPVQQ